MRLFVPKNNEHMITKKEKKEKKRKKAARRRKFLAHGLPVRIYRAKLPYLDADELRRKKITPPSNPGVRIARHH